MNLPPPTLLAQQRLAQIARARRAVLEEGLTGAEVRIEAWHERSWIERSWQRCLAAGRRPQQPVEFALLPRQAMRRTEEANRALREAAAPVLAGLARALAHSRYFAILTNAEGTVVDAAGPIDRSDRRAHLITRVGTDLSEGAVGTTAIGAVLAEQRPLWLHRGEHFFDDTSVYSCAGAPLSGPDGGCVGMLDLTGIDAPERPELKHLAAQSARSIENALVLVSPHALLLRLGWPGRSLGDDGDGLLCLDEDGNLVAANGAARELMAPLAAGRDAPAPVHCSELFAMPWQTLYDTAGRGSPREVPLWSGLTLAVLAQLPGAPSSPAHPAPRLPLRDLETTLIRRAVDEARGNVMQAARALGISRATVYRKLGRRKER